MHTQTFIQYFTKLCSPPLAHSSFLDLKSARAASEAVIYLSVLVLAFAFFVTVDISGRRISSNGGSEGNPM